MSDRRYSTSAWQRLRKAVLARDGYVCRVQGPRCTGRATSVHHVIPSSERPDLFWVDANLVSSCARCNYSDGSRVAANNRRRRVDELERIIQAQHQLIEQLEDRLAEYEDGPAAEPARDPPMPRIY